jgi:nifR3 family TIM-barrel protein
MEIAETKIGSVRIPGPIALAPLSGITDLACRLVAKSFGASLVYVPLISAKALCLGSKKTFDLLASEPAEKPVAVQIFAADPASIAGAVEILRNYSFDLIDINMGCPMPKVSGNAGGASLMREVKLAAEIVRAAVEAAAVPVTVKIRSGWDADSINAPEFAAALEDAGAAAVAVHPRTKAQRFAGQADWRLIGETKRSVNIPVIGSGDVCSPADARRMLEETGCDMVMIGRAARGNPWIFSQTLKFLQTGELQRQPTPEERVRALIEHCTLSAKYDTDRRAALRMRKHAGWYVKGLKNAAIIRQKINRAESLERIVEICRMADKDWHGICSP